MLQRLVQTGDRLARKALADFSVFLGFLFRFFLRRPALLIALTLAFTVFAAGGLPQLKTLTSFRDLFDRKFESVQRYDDVESTFEPGNSILLLTRSRSENWSESELCALHLWLTELYLGNPEIVRMSSAFDLREVKATPNTLHYQRLLKADCDASPGGTQTSEKLKEIVNSPWGRVLTDREGKDIATEITFRDTPGGSKMGRFDPRPIGIVMKEFDEKLGDRLEAVWTGPSMYDYYLREGMKRMPIMNIGVVLILLLFYRCFVGTWRSGLLLITTLILMGIFVYGWIGRSGAPIDILSSGLFLMITVSAHQDFSYVSSLQMERRERYWKSFRRLLVPSFFTSLTTVAGFSSLCLSDISVIQRFGFWASVGAAFEWAMIMLFMPCLMYTIPWFRNWVNPDRLILPRNLSFRVSRAFRPRPWTSWALMSLILLVPAALRYANFSDNPKSIFPESHPFQESLRYLNQSRGWDGALNLIYSARLTPERREELRAQIGALPIVDKIEHAEAMIAHLKQGQEPGNQELIERQLNSSPLLTRYRAEDGRRRDIVYVNSSDMVHVRSFTSAVTRLCGPEDCFISGPIDMYVEFTYLVSRTLTESLVLSMLLVSGIMVFLLRALRTPHGSLLILTSFWGPMAMLLLIALFQIPLNIYTANFAAVLVGLTGDNAIQFMFASRRGKVLEGMSARRAGAVFTSVVMASCSLVFLISVFKPPRVLGALLFAGFLLCLLGDYWIMKGLLPEKAENAPRET